MTAAPFPKITGVEVDALLRKIGADVAVVVISGAGTPDMYW